MFHIIFKRYNLAVLATRQNSSYKHHVHTMWSNRWSCEMWCSTDYQNMVYCMTENFNWRILKNCTFLSLPQVVTCTDIQITEILKDLCLYSNLNNWQSKYNIHIYDYGWHMHYLTCILQASTWISDRLIFTLSYLILKNISKQFFL